MRFILLTIILFSPMLFAADEDWGALHYLVGNWVGEGTGQPGESTGGFSFQPDLQGKILVRKSRAEYPPSKDRKAFVHEDLMVVYRELDDRAEGALRAVDFDSEQHVIRYDITMFGDRIVFTSQRETGRPQFRLTYERQTGDKLRLKFEIAPPGKGFAPYIEATAHRTR
jgi:hypothetical protein